MILIFDYDGTIVKDSWPGVGKLRFLAKPILKWLYRRNILILNTCREGQKLKEAVDFLNTHGVYFDYYNENCESLIRQFGDCRKISGDWTFDDKAGFLGWLSVPLIVLWLKRRTRK